MDKIFENADLTDLLLGLVLALLAIAMRWVAKKAKLNDAQNEAMEQILLATQEVRRVYVDAIREASKDGVVTDEEKKLALDLAKARLLERVGPEAKKLVLSWGEERLRGLLQIAMDKVTADKPAPVA
jgi:CRISPR/Cas system CSM-associated protein Csm2 small subunit